MKLEIATEPLAKTLIAIATVISIALITIHSTDRASAITAVITVAIVGVLTNKKEIPFQIKRGRSGSRGNNAVNRNRAPHNNYQNRQPVVHEPHQDIA